MSHRRTGPAALTTLGMLGFGSRSVASGNGEFIYYLAVMLVLIAAIWAIDARVRFSRGVLWGLAVWAVLHLAGGNVAIPPAWADQAQKLPVLYNLRPAPWLPRYDQIIHAYGFAIATAASWQALRAATGIVRCTTGVAVAIALIGMGLGAVNEVVEFIATRFMDTNVGGYENTGWDLVANGVGAAAAAAGIRLRTPPRAGS